MDPEPVRVAYLICKFIKIHPVPTDMALHTSATATRLK